MECKFLIVSLNLRTYCTVLNPLRPGGSAFSVYRKKITVYRVGIPSMLIFSQQHTSIYIGVICDVFPVVLQPLGISHSGQNESTKQ